MSCTFPFSPPDPSYIPFCSSSSSTGLGDLSLKSGVPLSFAIKDARSFSPCHLWKIAGKLQENCKHDSSEHQLPCARADSAPIDVDDPTHRIERTQTLWHLRDSCNTKQYVPHLEKQTKAIITDDTSSIQSQTSTQPKPSPPSLPSSPTKPNELSASSPTPANSSPISPPPSPKKPKPLSPKPTSTPSAPYPA